MNREEAVTIYRLSHKGESEINDTVVDGIMEMCPTPIDEYTRETFLETTEPFDYLWLYKSDPFTQDRLLLKVTEQAKKCKVTNFRTLFKSYIAKMGEVSEGNYTDFPFQPIDLKCGNWICDSAGVRIAGDKGMTIACPHPITIVARLCNIDTGVEKLKISFYRDRLWKEYVIDRKIICSASKITELADKGIMVTSETAKALVNYFADLEKLNADAIPQYECVTHLGWIDRGEGLEFSPFAEGIVFDGEVNYAQKFRNIQEKGNWTTWIRVIAKNIRNNNIVARAVFASAFASVLIKPLGCNNFWVHLWGESESAKTVLAMCAASVWGDPPVSKYIGTFDATVVGMEKVSSFYNSMPYIVDELQLVDSRKDMDNLIYMLTEGSGRTRGNKGGGVDTVSEWRNCVITTGERPITSSRSASGATNRVVEIECADPFFINPRELANTLRENYGFVGKYFVERLIKEGFDEAERLFQDYLDKLSNGMKITQKQAQSGALILTADKLITDWIFFDGQELTPEEIASFLKTKEDVSVSPRAYDFVCQTIAENPHRFGTSLERSNECWGVYDGNAVYIVKKRFEQICRDGGFNPEGLLSWLAKRGLIEVRNGRKSVLKRISGDLDGAPTRCIHLALFGESEEEQNEQL